MIKGGNGMLRTVYYARVSTDEDVQMHSLNEQKKYFEKYIDNQVDLLMVGSYIDEGISGTSIESRLSFQQMIMDAKRGKFDLILTKEVSRFARNTLDTIEHTRLLKSLGINVIFINDHIDTRKSDSEINLTLIATAAQEESRKISSRVKWSMYKEMEQGRMFITSIYGYDVKDGNLVINEKEAKIVRLIFDLYLSGYGYYKIANVLEEMKIKSPKKHKDRWATNTLKDMIQNVKYKGWLQSHKNQVVNYLTHEREKTPDSEQLVFKNHHEPIVSEEIFDKAQKIRNERNIKKINRTASSNIVLRKRLQCGYCNGNLTYLKSINGWNCKKIYSHQCINGNSIKENTMLTMLGVILFDFIVDTKKITNLLEKTLTKCKNIKKMNAQQNKLQYQLNSKKRKQDILLNDYLDGSIDSIQYNQLNKDLESNIKCLNMQIKQLTLNNPKQNYDKFFQKSKNDVSKYTKLTEKLRDKLISTFLEKAIIFSRNEFELYITSSNCRPDHFIKDNYIFLAESNYNFKYLESKYQQNYHKTLQNTKVYVYVKKEH